MRDITLAEIDQMLEATSGRLGTAEIELEKELEAAVKSHAPDAFIQGAAIKWALVGAAHEIVHALWCGLPGTEAEKGQDMSEGTDGRE